MLVTINATTLHCTVVAPTMMVSSNACESAGCSNLAAITPGQWITIMKSVKIFPGFMSRPKLANINANTTIAPSRMTPEINATHGEEIFFICLFLPNSVIQPHRVSRSRRGGVLGSRGCEFQRKNFLRAPYRLHVPGSVSRSRISTRARGSKSSLLIPRAWGAKDADGSANRPYPQ